MREPLPGCNWGRRTGGLSSADSATPLCVACSSFFLTGASVLPSRNLCEETGGRRERSTLAKGPVGLGLGICDRVRWELRRPGSLKTV